MLNIHFKKTLIFQTEQELPQKTLMFLIFNPPPSPQKAIYGNPQIHHILMWIPQAKYMFGK